MKTLKLLFIACLFSSVAFSQASGKKNTAKIKLDTAYRFIDELNTPISPDDSPQTRKFKQARILAKDHYAVGYGNIGIRFKSVSSTTNEIYQGLTWGQFGIFKSFLIEGDCSIEVSAIEITEKNADQYRYRVMQDGANVLVPWTKPTVFKTTADGKFRYAYLGLYPSNAPSDRELKIELYKNNRLIDAIVIGWGMIEPAIAIGYIQYTEKHYPSRNLNSRYLEDLKKTEEVRVKKVGDRWVDDIRPVTDFIETTSPNDIKFHAEDSLQLIKFHITSHSKLYNYKVVLHRDIDGKKDLVNLGETNDILELYKEFWKQPGKYVLKFIPTIKKPGGQSTTLFYTIATEVKFTVLPPLNTERSIPLKVFVFILLAVLATGLRIYFYLRRKQKLAAQGKEIATLQLQSVRSQLNPHFIFNALAGIQNLMNKNEVENANKYLARFARLTRNVLDDGQKELTPIANEVNLLTDYLQMEQMRFGFKFDINVSKGIDQQIEIPAMLLQPFAENAVKHGISALKDEGHITVRINQAINDITLTVTDNGPGFSKTQSTGMGIKLCKERIRLLNTVYKNTTILLHINPTDKGTTVTIELKNWL